MFFFFFIIIIIWSDEKNELEGQRSRINTHFFSEMQKMLYTQSWIFKFVVEGIP